MLISRRFLIAQLHMKLLSGHVTAKKARGALEKLPEKLGDAYDDIMDRINRQDENQETIAITALTWITYAKERLTVHQLLHAIALGLEPDSTDIESDDLVDVELLLSSCAGLVILNHEDGIIRLVHYTTQDYLENRFSKADANTSLAKSSLTCLALDAFSDLPVNQKELMDLMKRYPLSGYAARYWGHHARQGKEADLEQAILSTLGTQQKRDLLDCFEGIHFQIPWSFSEVIRNYSLLHLTSKHGLSQTCYTLLNHDVILYDPT